MKTEINTDVLFNLPTYGTLWCALLLFLLVGCSVASQNKVQDKPGLTSPDGQESSMSESFPLAPISQPLDKPLGSSKGTPKELEAVWEAWALLNRDHLDKASFNAEQFEEFAIKGLVAAVEDPHTSYVEPEVLSIERENLSGQFEGIGAHVRRREDGAIQIISPIEGGPAESAGIRAGDIVVSVNGESLDGYSLLQAVTKIRGPKGSSVLLMVKHIGELQPVEIEVIRGVIDLPSVLLRSETGDPITHIRITEFKSDTPDRLAEILEKEIEQGSRGIILDLRNNPGGYLQQVFEIADMFLDEGLILIEERKDGEIIWEAQQGGVAVDIPLVLIVNRYSASGSEILMGAFQDNLRAKIVGERSFGKGTVNVFRELSNGGGLYMSIGRWYTPKRRIIEGDGLEPDYEVTSKDTQKADVMQIEKAPEILNTLISK